jgi:predicted ATPase
LIEIAQSIKEKKAEFCVVTGQMGIGKSRLKEEFEKYITKDGSFKYLETHCSVEIPSPYFPFKLLLARYFEINENDDSAAVAKRINEAIARRHMSPLIAKGLQHLFLTDIQRIKHDEMLSINEEIYTSVKSLIRFESQANPLVIIFEEFNKADEMSKYLMVYLTSELKDETVMFLMVNVSKEFLTNIDVPIEEINLTPLAFHEIKDLIIHILDDVEETLVQFMYKSAGGNPLFTIEAVRNTRRTKVIKKVSGRWILGKDQHLSFLDDLYGVVMSTIDSLPSRYRLIVDYAAVVGYSFSYRILHGLLEYEGLREQLQYLVEEGYIIMSKNGQDPIYVFRHNLLKDAAYTVLPMRKRREIHKLVAILFEELYADQLSAFYENIAHHYLSCEDYGKAATYFALAGDKAKNLYAIEQALEFYNTVLEIDKDKGTLTTDLLRSVFLNMTDLYEITGDVKKMKKISEQGLESARCDKNLESEVTFLERFGSSLLLINKLNEAEELFLTAIDKCGGEMVEILAVLYSDLGLLYQARNEYEKSILHYSTSWKTAQAHKIKKGEILCLLNMAKLHDSLGNYEQALEYLDYGLDDLIPTEEIRWQLQYKYQTAQTMFEVWALAQCQDALLECFEIADSIDNIETYLKSALDLAIIFAINGDSQKADEYIRFADAKFSFFVRDELLAEINLRKAKINFYESNHQKAIDFAVYALKTAQKLSRRELECQCYTLLSSLESEQADEYARKALDIAEEIKLPPLIAAALFRMTEMFRAEEDFEKARHYGRKALFIHDDIKLKLKDGQLRFCPWCGTLLDKSSDLPVDKLEMVFMRADLSGFTKMSEKMIAEDVMVFLNEVFTHFSRIIESYKGVIYQIIGDEIVSVFGFPKESGFAAHMAVFAAEDMFKKLGQLNKKEYLLSPVGLKIGMVLEPVSVVNIYVNLRDALIITRGFGKSQILQKNAVENSMLVCENLYDATKAFFSFTEVGEFVQDTLSVKAYEYKVKQK